MFFLRRISVITVMYRLTENEQSRHGNTRGGGVFLVVSHVTTQERGTPASPKFLGPPSSSMVPYDMCGEGRISTGQARSLSQGSGAPASPKFLGHPTCTATKFCVVIKLSLDVGKNFTGSATSPASPIFDTKCRRAICLR